ncbi:putative RNA-directed DNA polymerase [Helianthus annuus]|nr:putative RNA-directed DNA polymerase [Helianthus annuus]
MSDDGKVRIEKFDGKNFGWWKMQIKDLLIQKDLDAALEPPPTPVTDKWTAIDKKAMSTIRLTLSMNVGYNISEQTSARGIIEALSNMYEKPSPANKVFLIRELVNTRMKEGSSVIEHINLFNSHLSRLNSVKFKIDNELQACLLLSSLPDSWSGTITAVTGAVETLTFAKVRDLILNEDSRRRNSGETSSLLSTEGRGRSNNRGGNRGRSKSKRRSKSRPAKPRKDIQCWNCDEHGHFRSQCTKPHRDKKEVNATTASDSEDALICCVENTVEDWIMDSGASFHATSSTKKMKNLRTGNFGKVRLANNHSLDITGIGDIDLKTPLGTVWTLKNVRVIPGLKRMLISIGQLDDQGYDVHFGRGQWKVVKGSMVIARGKKRGTLYMVEVPTDGVNAVSDGPSLSKLWHQRLGHMSEKGMKMLVTKGKLPELKQVESEFCEPCILGKKKKVTFVKTGRAPKAQKLELIHSDVYGPTSVASPAGSRYYVTFIDDSTRKVWVYFLKHKSEVFDKFKKWKAAVELETDLKVKCLKSDNGGEYVSKEFIDYCAERGIRMINTVPGTPQQNGVAERMNRTLCERARSMRLNAGLPKMFWADAVNTAAYLINRGPSVPLGFKIPQEEWKGKAVEYDHLRIFGCSAYDIDLEGDKLDAKAKKYTLVGYGSDKMGYRLWDHESRKLVRSKHAEFNEAELYKDRNSEKLEVQKEVVEFDTDGQKNEPVIEPESDSEDDTGPEFEGGDNETGEVSDSGSSEHEEQPPQQPDPSENWVRRSTRVSKPPNKYNPSVNYILLTENGEPESYSEAVKMKDFLQWEHAMKDEMSSLDKNKTWVLVKLPPDKRALQNKWVFRVKEEHDGSKRYKARLVVKGFQQKKGVDYDEIFSPVVKMTTIRLVLSIVAAEKLHLEQLDVKTAFLHGDLNEDIYMAQPEGFKVVGKENWVCKLKKSLYGLKQAPRQWYMKFDNFMERSGYKRCQMDHCCYLKKFSNSYIILLLYVDDMLIAGSDMKEISRLKKQMSKEFEMKDLGPAKQILGMSITRSKKDGSVTLSQEKYIGKVLERFGMNSEKTKPRNTPLGSHLKLTKEQCPRTEEEKADMARVPYASAVGSLMYAMVCTRPDIAHAVGVVSRFMSNPGREHWEAVKWVLRYLKGTSKMGMRFKGKDVVLKGYTDADLGGCKDTFKSTTGYVFTAGGTAVSWMSKLQKSVALSTTEAEYMAVAEASKELVWLKAFLKELGKNQADYPLYCDNESAVKLAKNPVYHGKTKHIGMRYHFVRGLISEGLISLKNVPGAKNPADMFTKVVVLDKLKLCIASAGLQE